MKVRAAVAILTVVMIGAACSDSEQLQSSGAPDEVVDGPSVSDGADDSGVDDAADADADDADMGDGDDGDGDENESPTTTNDSDQDPTPSDSDSRPDEDDSDSDNPSDEDEDANEAAADSEEEAADADNTTSSFEAPYLGIPTPIGNRPLATSTQGDSGEHVLALQERLAELGFAPGTPDGSYGQRTSKSIAAFQKLSKLEETGEADGPTMAALADYRYDGLLLKVGDEGDIVEAFQERLGEGPFDPGPVDGEYGTGTKQAVWALEKLAGIPVDGDWGPLDENAWQQLMAGKIGQPEKSHDTRWVEVDLSKQIMKVYDPDSATPVLISHASSGSGVPWSNEEHSGSSVTPVGDFHISRRINGWRESSLNIGRLYNPLYFNGGIAFHGATSVPLYPASHGCIRLPMHVADYLPGELPNGTPVHVLK